MSELDLLRLDNFRLEFQVGMLKAQKKALENIHRDLVDANKILEANHKSNNLLMRSLICIELVVVIILVIATS